MALLVGSLATQCSTSIALLLLLADAAEALMGCSFDFGVLVSVETLGCFFSLGLMFSLMY